MKKPTLNDVASHAGVSYATADRVLNGRANVSEKTAEKVRSAVKYLGYIRNVEAANLSRQKTYRFVFVIPAGKNAFFGHIREIINSKIPWASQSAISLEIEDAPAFDAEGLAGQLEELSEKEVDGIAVVGLEDDAVLAPLKTLASAGIPIVSLVSALPSLAKETYIGIDNVMAGRTAGRLIGMAHAGNRGSVQVIVGALNARDHNERLQGIQQVLESDYPEITILPIIQGRDNADRVATEITAVLQDRNDVTAVYNLGAGNSGLARVLSQRDKRPFCVVHELVAHSRTALEENTFDIVIDQRPEVEVSAALELLKLLCDGRQIPPHDPILPTIYVRDNLPPVTSSPNHGDEQ